MQSDVCHVLPPSENAAWPYMESTCADSQLHFPSSFHLPFFLSPCFPLCARVQQAWADVRLPCIGHTRDRPGVPYEPRGRNVHGTKGHGRWRRAERTDKSWEHTGSAQKEGRGSTQEPLRPNWSHGRWRLSRWRIHLSPTEHKNALGGSGLLQTELEGGHTGWG